MAITIRKQPQRLQPAYNPMIIVATSSAQSKDGFLMVGDVYVDGTYVTRMKVATNPDGFCIFDIHKHIENRISYDFYPNSFGWAQATQSAATYSVLLGEEYRPTWKFVDNYFLPGGKLGFIGTQSVNPSPEFQVGNTIFVQQNTPFTFSQYNGNTTITAIYATSSPLSIYPGTHYIIETAKPYLGSTPLNGGTISLAQFQTYIGTNVNNVGNTSSSDNQKWAFNGVNTFLQDISWTQSAYAAGTYSGGTASFLTNLPTTGYKMGTFSRMWLNVYQDSTNDITSLKIKTNNGTYTLTNTLTTPLLTNKQNILRVGCGPWQFLTSTASITGSPGSIFPMFDSNTTEYTIWCENSSNQMFIKPITFTMEDYCSRYEKIQLIFMDKLGSFVPFTFNFANRQNKTINRTSYQQHYGEYAPASNNWTYNPWDRGKKSLDTQITESYTITSDWVNQTTSDYLMTLMESPEVYWINEAGVAVAVSLTVSGTERKQTINDMIINYTINFELSNKNNTQRG